MYPYELIKGTGIDLYIVFILLGVISSFVTARALSGVVKMSDKVFNFVLLTAVIAIVLGWLSAMLFQAFYNFLATGVFEFVGQTFYGGLIGGAAVFLIVYFVAGRFLFKDRAHIKDFDGLVTLAMPAIVGAHALGRIGCLMDGCCYGEVTDAWYGIYMHSAGEWAKRVPTQLFESLFLFALYAVLVFLIVKKKFRNTPTVYLVSYGIWRFFIEFFRADTERGSSGIEGLYPSQVTAIILVVVGIVWLFVYEKKLKAVFDKLKEQKPEESEAPEQSENPDETVKSDEE